MEHSKNEAVPNSWDLTEDSGHALSAINKEATLAFGNAMDYHRSKGRHVVYAKGNQLVELDATGNEKVIKLLTSTPPKYSIPTGQRISRKEHRKIRVGNEND